MKRTKNIEVLTNPKLWLFLIVAVLLVLYIDSIYGEVARYAVLVIILIVAHLLFSSKQGKYKTLGAEKTDIEEKYEAIVVSYKTPNNLSAQDGMKQLYELEDKIGDTLSSHGAGFVDGHDLGEKECIVYSYGNSADQIYSLIKPILHDFSVRPINVTVRYGEASDPHAKQVFKTIRK